MKTHHRQLDIYGTDLHLAFDEEGWDKMRRRFPDLEPWKNFDSLATTVTNEGPGLQHIFFRIDVSKVPHLGPELVSLIAHEALHGALSILEHHGIPTVASNDEATAYLVGWLAAFMWSNLP